jgi:sigma54-dependent transcription regulator
LGCHLFSTGLSKELGFHWLNAIVESKAIGGMQFDELAACIERLNSLAEVGRATTVCDDKFTLAIPTTAVSA